MSLIPQRLIPALLVCCHRYSLPGERTPTVASASGLIPIPSILHASGRGVCERQICYSCLKLPIDSLWVPRPADLTSLGLSSCPLPALPPSRHTPGGTLVPSARMVFGLPAPPPGVPPVPPTDSRQHLLPVSVQGKPFKKSFLTLSE